MKVSETPLPGLRIIELDSFGDARGSFMELFQARRYLDAGIDRPFVQDNLSRSVKDTLRGLHFQEPLPQGKLVQVLQGTVFDVAVDLRRSSQTFGKWHGERLSAENKRQFFIPPGFAHGFLALADDTQVQYKVTDFWAPQAERTLAWNDPALEIQWPLPACTEPVLSDKDRRGQTLAQAEVFP